MHHSGAGPVVVVEVDPLGHRLQYVRLLHDAAARGPGALLAVTPAVRDAPEFATHLAGTEDVTVVLDDAGGRRRFLAGAVALAIRSGASRIVVPDGDKNLAGLLAVLLARALRRAPSPTVAVLLMRTALPGGPERATAGMVLKPLLVALLRLLPGVRLSFLTDAFGVVRRRRGFPGLAAVRDPVAAPAAPTGAPAAELVAHWPTAAGARRVGVLGVVSARKNLPVLLDVAVADAGLAVVVAGRCEPDVRRLLDTDERARRLAGAGRLVVDDRLLSEEEFDAALRSLDAVAVLHDNDAPSGIVAEACRRGVPVLGPDRGWVSRMVGATGVGRGARVDDPEAVGRALRELLERHDEHVDAARRTASGLGVDDFVRGLLDSG